MGIGWFSPQGKRKPFPGAEGYGSEATGGIGGEVLFVRNLNDHGPGSLREAVEATFARCIVFLVAGYIWLEEDFNISNGDVSIFGQSAPGMGIAVRSVLSHPRSGTPRVWVNASNVVIQYLRSRPGPSEKSSGSLDAITIGSVTGKAKKLERIIIDHSSASFSTDEAIGSYAPADGLNSLISLQWSIMSEPLHLPTPPHDKGAHGYANHWNGPFHSISIHHNLIAHADARGSRVESKHVLGGVDYRNNTIYNLRREWTALRANNSNYIGNSLVKGLDTIPEILMDSAHYANYLEGNTIDGVFAGQAELGVKNVSATEYPHPHIETQSAAVAKELVLLGAGASLWRDAIDERIVNDVRNGTGHIIDMPDEVGGYPIMTGGTPELDSDGDGIPDQCWIDWGVAPTGIWELDSHGVDYFSKAMEWYVNGVKVIPPDPPVDPDPIPPDPPSVPVGETYHLLLKKDTELIVQVTKELL